MTNLEKLQNMGVFKILKMINWEMDNTNGCIMCVLAGPEYVQHHCDCHTHCPGCIEAWLNKEVMDDES